MVRCYYTIRKALLVILGLNAFLLFCLFLISLFTNGNAMEKFILILFLLPAVVLFIECLLRRITVTEEGLVMRKLGRHHQLSWDDITRVGYLILHRKAYLLLTTVKGFFVISNAYEGFSNLVTEVVTHVQPERVEQDVHPQAGLSLKGNNTIIAAWFAAALMMAMIFIKIAAH